jgi:hypothetical protein
MNKDDRNMKTLARVLDDAAYATEHAPRRSEADKQWAKSLRATYTRKIAAARRALLPEAAPIRRGEPIRPHLAAMARDALVALFTRLTEGLGGELQTAHRDLAVLSDDDLRRLIQEIESASA